MLPSHPGHLEPCVCRFVKGSGSRRAGSLLPAILKLQQEAKLGAFEPVWWSACRLELPAMQGILGELHVLACYLCSLQSLLEGATSMQQSLTGSRSLPHQEW